MGFAIITFLLELFLYINALKKIKHLIPELLVVSGSEDFLSKIKDQFVTFITNIQIFSYKYLIFAI